jgi:hypothetical protein
MFGVGDEVRCGHHVQAGRFDRSAGGAQRGGGGAQGLIDAFRERWTATRNPRGGRPRRPVAAR